MKFHFLKFGALILGSLSTQLISIHSASFNMQAKVSEEFRIRPDIDASASNSVVYRWIFQADNCPDQNRDASGNCDTLPLVRRTGFYDPIIINNDNNQFFNADQFSNRVRMDKDTNDLIITDAQLADSGSYTLTITPPDRAATSWGPYKIAMYKRPEPLIINSSPAYKNNEHAIKISDNPTQKKVIATCIAKGAAPAMKLHWKIDTENGQTVIVTQGDQPQNSEPVFEADGTYTTMLDLDIVVESRFNGKNFICQAEQPGIPADENVKITNSMMVNVLFPPEDTRLEMVEFTGISSDPNSIDSNSPVQREVVCRSNANPPPRFNISMPSGAQMPRGGASKPMLSYRVPFENSGLDYRCTARNSLGVENVQRSVDDLMNLDAGGSTIIFGLPLWAWIIIILAIILFIGIVLVCVCSNIKSSDSGSYQKRGYKSGNSMSSTTSKKKFKRNGSKSTQITKLDISLPKQNDHLLHNMSERQNLRDVERRDSNDSNNKKPLISHPISNPMGGGGGATTAYAPNPTETLQEHITHLQNQNNDLRESEQYIAKTQELLRDNQYQTELDIDHPNYNGNTLHTTLGHDYDAGTGVNNNNLNHPIQTNIPIVPGSNNHNQQIINENYPTHDESQDQFGNLPGNFIRNNPSTTASNRPYSEIFGYGGSTMTQASNL